MIDAIQQKMLDEIPDNGTLSRRFRRWNIARNFWPMKIIWALALCLIAFQAFAQSQPGWKNGQVHSADEFNALWAGKQDYAGVGAPFLSLAGGTLSGPLTGTTGIFTGLTVNNTFAGKNISLVPGTTTFDGSGNINRTLNINTNLTGTTTGPGIQNWGVNVVTNADTLNQTAVGSIAADIGTIHNFGGAGFHGGRLGFFASLFQVGAITGTPGVFENIISGAQLSVTLTNTFGGSGVTPSTAAGFATALNPFLAFTSGATNLGGGSGMEIDVLTGAGTSMMDAVGTLIFRYPGSTVQAARDDVGLVIASPTQTSSQGWKVGIQFGSSGGGFMGDPLGTLIGAAAGTGTKLAAKGIAWSGVTFSTSAFETPGFTVGGTGIVTALHYNVGVDQVVGARDAGWAAMTGTPDKATAFATSTVTLAQLAGRVMSLQAALTTHGLVGP